MLSYNPASCLPNPVCQSQNITFKSSEFNNTDLFTPILDYNGDPSLSPFTLDSGSLGSGPEGVLLEMTIDRQAKISTTRYMLYGSVSATLRHEARQGLVATMITMSDIKDEIDWEFTTADSSEVLTNYFYMGNAVTTQGATLHPKAQSGGTFDVAEWHEYGLDWQPDSLKWLIDGKVVRTVTKQEAGVNYPRSPSRVQFSTWAGGNSTNPQGTIEWAGGPIDWTTPEYKSQGYYAQEIKSFSITCASLTDSDGGNSATDATAWVYTGANSTTTNEPEFRLSSDKIEPLSNPSRDGIPGSPGYDDRPSAGTGPGTNRWDGSGSKSKSSSSSDSNDNDGVTSDALMHYGLPVAGALVCLIALWGAAVVFYRRRQKSALHASGLTTIPGGPSMNDDSATWKTKAAASTGLYAVTSGALGRKESKYIPLQDLADPSLPHGTQRNGTGIAPAPGPSPSVRLYNGYRDASPPASVGRSGPPPPPPQPQEQYRVWNERRLPPQQYPQQPWQQQQPQYRSQSPIYHAPPQYANTYSPAPRPYDTPNCTWVSTRPMTTRRTNALRNET
ncbi:putative glycosidase CRH2 [Thecaphora frezii]